jgi:hypothetical protein
VLVNFLLVRRRCEYCVRFLDAAAGGSVLVTAVEEMPATAQDP